MEMGMSLVKRLHEESLGWGTGPSILCAAAASEITRLRARVAELEAALKPFALQSDKLHSGFDDGILAGDTPLANVFVCDLRRASAVLKKENEK